MQLKSTIFLVIFSGLISTQIAKVHSEEMMVSIQKVDGNRITVLESSGGGRGGFGGGRGPGQGSGSGMRRGKGRRRFGGNSASQKTIVIPANVKVTSAKRERRTFKFMVGAEIPGGFKNAIFRKMESPMQARILTDGNRIVEVNVITPATDINQSNSDASGGRIIAVRPKRPPSKRKK